MSRGIGEPRPNFIASRPEDVTQEKRLRGGFAALWLLRLRRLTDALSRTVASDAFGKRHERQIV
ncbi:hypothetical protein, partial [Paraburkholderia strydomiana]|uniref:hypothetical protein n=1 Tax=Paraburkholderia strydomiana TaxID=1245417 RepID=UPI0038BD9C90